MKNLIIVAFLSLFCLTVKAQLNQSISQIKQDMSNENGWVFKYYGEARDGYLDGAFALQYMQEKQFLGKCFYFVNDSCKLIKFSYLNEWLEKVTKDMNSLFIHKGSNIWIDEKAHIKYELFPDKERIGIFNISETTYSVSK